MDMIVFQTHLEKLEGIICIIYVLFFFTNERDDIIIGYWILDSGYWIVDSG